MDSTKTQILPRTTSVAYHSIRKYTPLSGVGENLLMYLQEPTLSFAKRLVRQD